MIQRDLRPTPRSGMRPRARRGGGPATPRFNVAHEISHTFFPNYQSKTWCRTDARIRRRDDPDDLLEMLCDVGAAELVLPLPWFPADAARVTTAAGLIDLARSYTASREATLRRFAETNVGAVAAVFFSWKLKPKQERTIGRTDQPNLFGTDPAEDARLAKRLRLDYSIASPAFSAAGHFLPADKSIDDEGPTYTAASTGVPSDGECRLDLGQAAGMYRVMAIPLWTDDGELGPQGENAVAAVIDPVDVKRSRKKARQTGPSLF